MRLKIYNRALVVVYCFLFALVCSAQTTGISGKYEGAADVQPFGKLTLKGDIREKDGKLSGVINTPLGDARIIEASFKDGNLMLKLDAGGDDINLNGKVGADGKITGEVKSLTANGTFELKRVGDASPETSISVVLSQSKEKWREDVRFLAAEIPKRHKNAFHTVEREQFEKAVAELDAKIPNLSDGEIVLGMVRLTAMIGDGHTRLGWAANYPRLPIQFFWFGKELRVYRVGKEFPRANGARLVKIEGVGVEEILRRSRDYISQGESEGSFLAANAAYLRFPVFLHAIGVAKNIDKVSYEFVDAEDKNFTLEMRAVPPGTKMDFITPYKTAPLYLQRLNEPIWYTYLKDAQTVYVNFISYPRRQDFAKFSDELFDFIDKNPVNKIVIDVRLNGGGDFTRGKEYIVDKIKKRKQFLERGKVFVLAGRWTFSAAMSNTAHLKNEANAIVVGEPTGARPNGYQENDEFRLPNSNLEFSVSTREYKFSEHDTPGILPDKLIEPNWKSYAEGRDPALEWILDYPKGK